MPQATCTYVDTNYVVVNYMYVLTTTPDIMQAAVVKLHVEVKALLIRRTQCRTANIHSTYWKIRTGLHVGKLNIAPLPCCAPAMYLVTTYIQSTYTAHVQNAVHIVGLGTLVSAYPT